MKKYGLVCRRKKKYKRSSSSDANDLNIAANYLQRQFHVTYPNQVWVGTSAILRLLKAECI